MSEILTDALKNQMKPLGLMFEKSTPKKKKDMRYYAERAKKQHHIPLKSTKKKSKPKIGRKKLPSIKSIKKRTWNLFSLFIRARDKKCVLCGSVKGFSAGHLIPISKASTRYDENNVFGLCSTCNFRDRFEPGFHDRYVAWYFVKFGAGKYIKLVEKSKGAVQYKRFDYENIIKKYGNTSSLSKM